MLFSKIKDLRLRQKFLKSEYKIKVNKYLHINLLVKLLKLTKFKKKIKQPFLYKALYFKKKNLNYNKIKIVRRCLYTNRNRSVYRKYNLSRNIFRSLIQFGFIPGYKKAAW